MRMESTRHSSGFDSCTEGRRQMWANMRAISMFMWMTRDVSKMRRKRNRPMVMARKMMISVDAPRVITVEAVF